jgi:hypothetical protein
MTTFQVGRDASCIGLAVAALAGCGGSQSQIGGTTVPEGSLTKGNVAPPLIARPRALKSSKRVLLVSNLDGGIRIYTANIHAQNLQLLGTITAGAFRPGGLWVDSKDTLYAVNDGETFTFDAAVGAR